MHETRYLGVDAPTLTGGSTYYGSVDATPLFVVLLGRAVALGAARGGAAGTAAARRSGARVDARLRRQRRRRLPGVPHHVRARPGEPGWKDSGDGIRYHDGRIAEAPLALCEVQGYAYAAYIGRVPPSPRASATRTKRPTTTDGRGAIEAAVQPRLLADRARLVRRGARAEKEPVDSLASNMGHCLWSGIVADEPRGRSRQAADVAGDVERLGHPHAGAATRPAYDPMSYHCGTVWPHDGALCAAGLRAYGFDVGRARPWPTGCSPPPMRGTAASRSCSADSTRRRRAPRCRSPPRARRRPGPRPHRSCCCARCSGSSPIPIDGLVDRPDSRGHRRRPVASPACVAWTAASTSRIDDGVASITAWSNGHERLSQVRCAASRVADAEVPRRPRARLRHGVSWMPAGTDHVVGVGHRRRRWWRSRTSAGRWRHRRWR